jgi:transcription elongation factor
LRRGSNKRDLAYVLRADVYSDRVQIAVMPRMPFTVPRNPNENLRKRKRHVERLAALPFDPTVIEHVHGPDALEQRGDSYLFENKTFRNGMLILNVQSLHTLNSIPFPSLREIQPFVEAGFLTHEVALHMTLHEELARIRPGDRVRLIAGERTGSMAMVLAIEDYIAYVDINPFDMEPDGPSHLMNVPIYHMQRYLHLGAHVRVRDDAEERAGSSGHVVAISEDQQIVRFIESKTGNSVSFF